MNPLVKILFLNVAAVIFLHASLSHRHHGEMTYEEHTALHNKADDIIDYLKLEFHKSLTDDLENFILTEQYSLKQIYFHGNRSLTNTSFKTHNSNNQTDFLYSSKESHCLFSISILSNGMRAPPIYNYL